MMYLDESKSFYKENKRLKEKIKELEKRLEDRSQDNLLVDVMNAYLQDRKTLSDFETYVHTHTMEDVFKKKDKLRDFWSKL